LAAQIVIGLDTNILVRYFAQDDPKQSALVNRAIAALSKDEPGFISLVTLCELVWVLETGYDLKKPSILDILRTLFESDELAIENKPVAWAALADFTTSALDFSDAVIAGIGKQAGCVHTLTFDRQAARSSEFVLLK
jgi:predicted nucleic-acid-binding protein